MVTKRYIMIVTPMLLLAAKDSNPGTAEGAVESVDLGDESVDLGDGDGDVLESVAQFFTYASIIG